MGCGLSSSWLKLLEAGSKFLPGRVARARSAGVKVTGTPTPSFQDCEGRGEVEAVSASWHASLQQQLEEESSAEVVLGTKNKTLAHTTTG